MTRHIFMGEVVQPVLIKDGALFLGCQGDGDIAAACGSGLGLFHHDTRYVSRYELRIGGRECLSLMASAARGDQSVHELTNDTIRQLDGAPLDVQSLGVRLERRLDGEAGALTDRLVLRNFTKAPVSFRLTLLVDALFEDLFELRGAKRQRRGEDRVIARTDAGLVFRYLGADGVARSLTVAFSPVSDLGDGDGACVAVFDVRLAAQASETLTVAFAASEAGEGASPPSPAPPFYDGVRIASDNRLLDEVMERSLRDLAMLRTPLDHDFIAGGMPWFVAPFGRDSMLAALQTLAFDTRPAEGVARLFAAVQGRRDDRETGEQPGKIAHELRLGEMARLKEIPHRPSYMSVDSTPLFLVLIGAHAAWTGGVELFQSLRPSIDAALGWIDRACDAHEGGWLAYEGETADGPINQGWKDSNFGVPRKDGAFPKPPIALCEVQGYVFHAWTLIAAALRQTGEGAAADRLETKAAALKTRFNRDFWMADEGCYALALERGGRQVTVVTSNAGQVLWSGIADADKAARVAERLLRGDMDSGWGIRTLSTEEITYNPLNYHLGSVWPFDTALIVAGLKRYGLDEAALKLFGDVLAAASHFSMNRLPEFYVGFQREADLFPARCPFAEPLQAWSSGAVPYMLASLLGLRRGQAGIEFDRPLLPASVTRLGLRGLDTGKARMDCSVGLETGTVVAECRASSEASA